MMDIKFSILGLVTALVAVTGCFKEPQPAYKTVPAETQVYLKDKGLTQLTVEDVYNLGQVFVDERSDGNLDDTPSGKDSEPRGHYEALSDRVSSPLDVTAITYLNLDYNDLTNVDEVVRFTGLKWLRLNNNRLSDLPAELSALTELRRLYLRDNLITDLAMTNNMAMALNPEKLPQLETIDLSGNAGITMVPDWLALRKGLQHLSLSNTSITNLPPDLTNWQSLKSLQLGGLKLESVEEMQRIRKALPSTTIVF